MIHHVGIPNYEWVLKQILIGFKLIWVNSKVDNVDSLLWNSVDALFSNQFCLFAFPKDPNTLYLSSM